MPKHWLTINHPNRIIPTTCYIYDYLGGIQNACDGYDLIHCLPAMISLVKRLAYFS